MWLAGSKKQMRQGVEDDKKSAARHAMQWVRNQ
jgi:hypothetical protein